MSAKIRLKKKYQLPQIFLDKPYKVREYKDGESFVVPNSANVDTGLFFVYGDGKFVADDGYRVSSIYLSLSQARKLGRFIRDTIGLR